MATSSSNKLMEEINDQFLVCKICYDMYKQPKTLSCLHTFCTECLEKHQDAELERSYRYLLYSRAVSCPICRKKTEVPTGGIKRLPDNFLVANLADIVNRRKPSDKVQKCEICRPADKVCNPAVSKCLDCCKFLCRPCLELHKRTKVTQSHAMYDVDVEKDIECKIHQDEVVRFYCEPCEVCVCVVCTFQEHKGHEVSSFTEGIEKYRNSLDVLLVKCRERIHHLKDQLSLITKCESNIKTTEEQITGMAIESISAIRKREKETIRDLFLAYGEESIDFIKEKEFIQESIESLQTTCNLTDIILQDKSIELLLLKKEIQEKLNLLLQRKWICPPDIVREQVKFVPGCPELGYLQIGESHIIVNGEKTDLKSSNKQSPPRYQGLTVDTQTEHVTCHDTSTSMGKLVQPHGHEQPTQTDLVLRKETGTLTSPGQGKPTMHTKCTLAVPEVKDRQTMTVNTPTMKRKVQTETVSRSDQHTSTSSYHTETGTSCNTQTIDTADRSTMTKMCNYKDHMTSTEELITTKNNETSTEEIQTKSCTTETNSLEMVNQGTLTIKPFSADKKTATPRIALTTRQTNTPQLLTYDAGVTAKLHGQDVGVSTRTIVTSNTGTGDNSVQTSEMAVETPWERSLKSTAEKQTTYDICGTDRSCMTDVKEATNQSTFTNYFNMTDGSTETEVKQFQSTQTSTATITLAEITTNTDTVCSEDKGVHVDNIEEKQRVETLDEICQTMISIIDAVLWPSMMPVTTGTNTDTAQYTEQGTDMVQVQYADTGINTIKSDFNDAGVGEGTCLACDMGCNTIHTVISTGDVSVGTESFSTQDQSSCTNPIKTKNRGIGTKRIQTHDSSHDAFRGHLKDVDTNTDHDVVVKPSVTLCDASTSTQIVDHVDMGTSAHVPTQDSQTETVSATYISNSTSTDPPLLADADTTMGSTVRTNNVHVNTAHIELVSAGCGTPRVNMVDAMMHTEPPAVRSQTTETERHEMVTKGVGTKSIVTNEVGMVTHVDVTTTGVDARQRDMKSQETFMEPVFHNTVSVGSIDIKSHSKGVATDPAQTREFGMYTYTPSVEKATYMPQAITISTGTATNLVLTAEKTAYTDQVNLTDGGTNTVAPRLTSSETTMDSGVMTRNEHTCTEKTIMVDSPNDPIPLATGTISTNTPHIEHRTIDTSTTEVSTFTMGTTTNHMVAYTDQHTNTESQLKSEQSTSMEQVEYRNKAVSIKPISRSVGVLKRPHAITRGTGAIQINMCTSSTSPNQPYIADQGTMTTPDSKNKSILCKPFDLVDQSTATLCVDHVETFTEMPQVSFTNVGFSPDTQVCVDRGSSPVRMREYCERESSPISWPMPSVGTTVKPQTRECQTSTAYIDLKSQETCTTQIQYTDRSSSPIMFQPDVTTVHRGTAMPEIIMKDQTSVAEPPAVTTGVNTTQLSYVDRESTPIRYTTSDQGVNAVVIMSTKEASTPHITTTEQGTVIRQPRTTQSGTSMPHISFLEKETSTPYVLTMHKNISTENMDLVDKQTNTTHDITAAYRDITTAPKAITVTRGTAMAHSVMQSKHTSPPPVVHGVERASSPVKNIMVDKAVLAKKGQILEPVDQYQAAGSDKPKKLRSKEKTRGRLASIEEDDTESSMESLEEDTLHVMSPLLYPPHSPLRTPRPRLPVRGLTHKERLWPSTPRMGKGAVSAFNFDGRSLPTSIVCKVEMGTNTSGVGMQTRGTSTAYTQTSDIGVSTEAQPVETRMAECISKLRTVRNRLEQKPASPEAGESTAEAPVLDVNMRSKSVGDNLNDNELVPLASQLLSTSGSSDGGSCDGEDKGCSPRLKARKQRLDINQLLRSSSLPESANPPPPTALHKPNIQTVRTHVIPKINLEDFKPKVRDSAKKGRSRPSIPSPPLVPPRRRSNSQGSELIKNTRNSGQRSDDKRSGVVTQISEERAPEPPRRSSSLRHALLMSRSQEGTSHKEGSPSKK